jgi:hypothetical protein
MIPDDMSIPSSASLAYRGGAMLNFAITEFYEVRGFLGDVVHLVLIHTYTSLTQEYAG